MAFKRFGFGAGLMDRDLMGRVDVDSYHRGCSVLENFEVFQTGAIRRRCGSRFVADLGDVPLALGAFRWSDGQISLLVVMRHEVRVYSSVSGVLIFRQAYDAAEGMVRMLQINDLVIILNNKRMPCTLKNIGGIFSLEEIAWKYAPLEGSWDQDFPLSFSAAGLCYVAERWDSFEKGESSGGSSGGGTVDVNHVYHSWDFATYCPNQPEPASGANRVEWIAPKLTYDSGLKRDVYYWYRNVREWGRTESTQIWCYFPSIKILKGQIYKISLPGNWAGNILIEQSSNNANWSAKLTAIGSYEKEFQASDDIYIRFRLLTYSALNWVERPQIIVFDRIVLPDPANEVKWANYRSWKLYPNEIIAVKHKVGEEKSGYWKGLLHDGVSDANLRTTSYSAGTKLRGTPRDGIIGYWTCKKAWTANNNALTTNNLNLYPQHFEPGLGFAWTLVGGAWQLESKNLTSYVKSAVQSSIDGNTWQNHITQIDTTQPSVDITMTGDNGGEPLLMRAVILEHASGLDTGTINKAFVRKNYTMVHYLKIVRINDDGTFNYQLLNHTWMFDVINTWDWDKAAFRHQNGYPSAAAMHAGRLVFAGTEAQPLTLWFSSVDDLFNYRTGTDTADAMTLTVAATQQSNIVWLASSGAALLAGTTTGEIAVRSVKDVLSSATASAEQHSNCGSCPATSVMLTTDAIMFIDRSGIRLRRMSYSLESEFYSARDMTVFASGVLSGGVVGMCWQRAPQPVAWVVPATGINAGKLCGMLYNPDQQISSWFVWDVGAQVMAVACTSTGDAVDPLFYIVERGEKICLETIDWQERGMDGVGGVETSFKATVVTTPLDSVDVFGTKGAVSNLHILMSGVDVEGAELSVGGTWSPCASVTGDGWVKVQGMSNGQYIRQIGIRLATGHGKLLAATLE